MPGTETRAPVPVTIAAGLSVIRRVGGEDLRTVADELRNAAEGHSGVEIRETFAADLRNKAQLDITKSNQIRRNGRLLGGLARTTVYQALEDLPSLSGDFGATAIGLNPEDEITARGNRVLKVTLDEAAQTEIHRESNDVRLALAKLAGIPSKAMSNWHQVEATLVVAHAAPDTPPEVFQDMRQSVEANLPFDFYAHAAIILPRMRG
jgi:hypothetical protein